MSPDDPRHGTSAGHHAGCREDCCREARNRYERNARKRRAMGRRGLVDSNGTKLRIQALMALGWPGRVIAERARIKRGQAGVAALLHTSSVRIDTANRVAKAYDELSMTVGPSSITRSRAAVNRWLPPLALDDDLIDQPGYVVARRSTTIETAAISVDEAVILRVLSGENLPTNKVERHEILRRWIARGGSEAALCKRMGWKTGRYSSRIVGNSTHSEDDQSTDRKAS